MGSVWLAEHLSLAMEVAVKFIRPERAAADPTLVQRFEREAKAAARITSPHVVQIKDYGIADETTPYIVMERLRGRSLTEVLDDGGRLSLRRVGEVVVDVAEALASAHALGIIHRDIKPQNIYITEAQPQPVVKVLDFGVAKVVSDAQVPGGTAITETGMVIGSPPYMSPEQLEGSRDVDQRADTWSLGIVAYQALTGVLPFRGGSFVRVGANVLRGKYVPASELRPELPKAIDDWFAKALCVNRDGRFESARAMAQAFAQLLVAMKASVVDHVPSARTRGSVAHATTELDSPLPEHTATSPRAARAPAGHTAETVIGQTTAAETVSSISMGPRRMATVRWLRPAVWVAALSAGVVGLWLALDQRHTDAPAPPAPSVSLAPGSCPPAMIFVPGGAFDMGTVAGDDVRNNETPQHRVEVEPFCIDTTEVTVAAYAECGSCGAAPQSVDSKEITSRAQQFWSRFCNAGHADRQDHPINCVSWNQAQGYCAARGKRLPSEREWELAARGSEGRLFPWGNDAPSATLVNACGAECSGMLNDMLQQLGTGSWSSMYDEHDGAASTAPVGSYPRGGSPLGVLDLAGNVWEWTASAYCYYDEQDCVESRRVLRGGGWDIPDPNAVRTTRRHPGAPNGRGHNIGFRCAWSAR